MIKENRKKKNFSQEQLAEILGISTRQLQRIEKNEEETRMGHLIYFFELACAMSGNILGVNPFNQPGVEEYKKNMFRLIFV
mgnify:CR=1 FL=1